MVSRPQYAVKHVRDFPEKTQRVASIKDGKPRQPVPFEFCVDYLFVRDVAADVVHIAELLQLVVRRYIDQQLFTTFADG